MGLSVHVYKNIKPFNEDECDFTAYVIDKDWKHKIKNLVENQNYSGEICDCGVSYPYSQHNRFREQLIKLLERNDLLKDDGKINWYKLEKETEIPFYDLINFADNEGCLDWEVSETLHNHFKTHQQKAMSQFDEYWKQKYLDWLEVFEQAKKKGVVVFR